MLTGPFNQIYRSNPLINHANSLPVYTSCVRTCVFDFNWKSTNHPDNGRLCEYYPLFKTTGFTIGFKLIFDYFCVDSNVIYTILNK